MKIVIACRTLEDEIKSALIRLKLDYQVVWLEEAFHSKQDQVRRAHIQQLMDKYEGQCETLIFALGYCGGAMCDLNTGSYTTIIPLSDDCLTLLQGSLEIRESQSQPATYFLTGGWLRHVNNMVDSSSLIQKYGQAKADRINKMIMAHYKRIGLVDTGCYDLPAAEARVAPLAEKLDMTVACLPGDSSWLDTLLTGPWDDSSRFLMLPPNSQLNFEDWAALYRLK